MMYEEEKPEQWTDAAEELMFVVNKNQAELYTQKAAEAVVYTSKIAKNALGYIGKKVYETEYRQILEDFIENIVPPPPTDYYGNIPPKKRFREIHSSVEERRVLSAKLIQNYPRHFPVIIENYGGSFLPDIKKNKFIVPEDFPIFNLLPLIKANLNGKIKPSDAIYMFAINYDTDVRKIINYGYKNGFMRDLLSEFKTVSDGFLYIGYRNEDFFG